MLGNPCCQLSATRDLFYDEGCDGTIKMNFADM